MWFRGAAVWGLDDWIISRFYDAQQHAFPLRNAFLTQTVLHDGGRRAMQLFVALLVVALLASPFVARLKPWRWRLLYLVIAIGLSVGTVNVGKRVSNVDCPWDLTAFGGDRVHYGLFDRKPPSAHLSASVFRVATVLADSPCWRCISSALRPACAMRAGCWCRAC